MTFINAIHEDASLKSLDVQRWVAIKNFAMPEQRVQGHQKIEIEIPQAIAREFLVTGHSS